jgi:hypothetical protein
MVYGWVSAADLLVSFVGAHPFARWRSIQC